MNYSWVESNIYEPIPPKAVWCSKDKEGNDIFIGKYSHNKSVLAVRIVPAKTEAVVPYNGKEIPALSYQVLVSARAYQIWVRVVDGKFPISNVMECGHDKNNNKLFVGRTFHKGYLLPGYVHSVTKLIHISYAGRELTFPDYEVLINYSINNNL